MDTLYDAAGRPIEESLLQEEISAPVDYVRPIWTDTAADKLTPDNLARMLQLAREGDAREYLTLADDMEEREPHYSSVLRTRKLAVSGIAPQVKSVDKKDTSATEIAEAVENLVEEPEFGELIADLLDAMGKGYAACEIMWDRSGKIWRPQEYKWRDPRFFRFDIQDKEKLKLLDSENMLTGIDLPPYKFVVHYPKLKSGLKISSGLARLAAVSYMCKVYTIKDMMRFIEVFGMPLRIGKYKAGANKDDISTLRRAVVNLGYDAAAVIPDSMKVEFVETSGGGSSKSNPFRDIADLAR
jgi:phage gp29-like protein